MLRLLLLHIVTNPDKNPWTSPLCRDIDGHMNYVRNAYGIILTLLLASTGLHGQTSGGGTGGGGGGNLPTAAAAGQIVSSTTAGTTYAVQPQIFYSQSGDTITSIEAKCSSLCTYVVTIPQTMTLAGDHALNANVQLDFKAGGSWTISGATFTLTIPTQISGALTQHFVIGTGTLTFGAKNSLIPVEWFGAVGDWNGTTGTDNTTAIQNTLNALTSGQALLQAVAYKTTAALSITRSTIGIAGTVQMTLDPGGIYTTGSTSRLVTTSASADVIDVAGTNLGSGLIFGNKFNDFGIERSVVPTGTAAGLSVSFVANGTIKNVTSSDSMRCFYIHAFPSGSTGIIENTRGLWGYNGFTETTGSFYGYYLDSADGNAQDSLRLLNGGVSSNLSATPTTYGMIITGSAINDVTTYDFETAGVSYGQYVIYTGGGLAGFSTSDIHLLHGVHDNCLISCYFVSGLTAATGGSLTIDGGRAQSYLSSGNLIDIESSFGVSVIGVQITKVQGFGSGVPVGLAAVNSSNIIVSNNIFADLPAGSILFSSTSDSTISGNNFFNVTGAAPASIISLTGTSANNILSGNSLSGFATTGVTFGSSTTKNTLLDSTAIDTTNITTAVNSASITNTIGSIASQALGLIENWYSQEGQGTIFANSGYDFTNSLTGTSTTQATATGFPGKVTTYNGTTSVSNATSGTNTAFDGTLPFSLCATVNLNIAASASTIMSNLSTATGNPGYSLRVNSSGALQFFLIFTTVGTQYINVNSANGTVTTLTPARVCVTYDGSQTAAGVGFFVNGIASATTTFANALTGSSASTTPIRVGLDVGGVLPATGAIGNIRIWNRQLTLADNP